MDRAECDVDLVGVHVHNKVGLDAGLMFERLATGFTAPAPARQP